MYKVLLSWSPWALVIATFDSLFISVVEKVSDEEEVRNGVKCDFNVTMWPTKEEIGAVFFYEIIILIFLLGVWVFCVIQCRRVCKWWNVTIFGKKRNKCCIISIISSISFAYTCFGLAFITFDNNWPWICFAKYYEMSYKAAEICSWISTRVLFLSILSATLCISCGSVAIFILWELYTLYQL